MVESQLRFDEGPLRDHEFIFMAFNLFEEFFRHWKACPILSLFRQIELYRNLDLRVSKYFCEILSSTICFSLGKSQFFNFSFVVLKESYSVKSLEALFPDLHNEEVGIQSKLSLFVGIWCQCSQHRVNSNQLLEVRTVQKHRLTIFFLTLWQGSGGLLGTFWPSAAFQGCTPLSSLAHFGLSTDLTLPFALASNFRNLGLGFTLLTQPRRSTLPCFFSFGFIFIPI